MKITKESLAFAFAEIAGIYEGSKTEKTYMDYYEALNNDELEIEGYNKMETNDENKNPHFDLIVAWANGKKIQVCDDNGEWVDCVAAPTWNPNKEYRIKPNEEVEANLVQHVLTEGEIKLINGLRKTRIEEIFDNNALINFHFADNKVSSEPVEIAFSVTDKDEIINLTSALEKIRKEQEEGQMLMPGLIKMPTKQPIWHQYKWDDPSTYPPSHGSYAVKRARSEDVTVDAFLKTGFDIDTWESDDVTHWAYLPDTKKSDDAVVMSIDDLRDAIGCAITYYSTNSISSHPEKNDEAKIKKFTNVKKFLKYQEALDNGTLEFE